MNENQGQMSAEERWKERGRRLDEAGKRMQSFGANVTVLAILALALYLVLR